MNNVDSRGGNNSIKYISNINSGLYHSVRNGSSINPGVCV